MRSVLDIVAAATIVILIVAPFELWRFEASAQTSSPPAATAADWNPDLADTVWIGKEDFAGHGRLEFQFTRDGVVMTDRDGKTGGTYSVDGDQVKLSFHQSFLTYTGTLRSGTLTGAARRSIGGSWRFRVAMEPAPPRTSPSTQFPLPPLPREG